MNSSTEPLSQFPQNRDELYLQAVNLRLINRFDEALAVLERLQQLHPGYSRLYEERGYCYDALNNAPQAIVAFCKAVSINAALPASWHMLHILYQGVGDEENATKIGGRLATLRNLPPEIIEAGSLFADGELVHAERVLRIYLAQHGEHIEAIFVTTILFGQEELKDRFESLQAHLRDDLKERFLRNIYEFEGIADEEELRLFLVACDTGSEYPSGSGLSYTRFLWPKAFAGSFRLANYARDFWEALVDSLLLTTGCKGIGMNVIAEALAELADMAKDMDTVQLCMDKKLWLRAIQRSQ